MKLRYKFFIAFLLASFMIVTLMVGITQILIHKNFEDYVNRTLLEKKQSGSFHQSSVTILQHASGRHSAKIRCCLKRFCITICLKKRPLPDKIPFQQLTMKKPPGPGFGPPPPDPFHAGRRLCLFDKNKHPVAGDFRETDRFTYRPIILDGKKIGWLGLKKGIRQPALWKTVF